MNIDQQYIEQLRSGDMRAFEYLYNKWSGRIYNFVIRISGQNNYLAEEMVQTVFTTIWEKKAELDPQQSFSSYLFTITKNQLSKVYRQQMYELLYKKHTLQYTSGNGENTTENEVEFRLLDEYIDLLIEQLPEARRRIFIMSRKQFMTNKEIANELNIAEHTVESQLTKANNFMRTQIKQHYELSVAILFAILMR